MKKFCIEFLKRGLVAAAGGPVILAVVYLILGCTGVVDTLSPFDVSKGVLTVTVMAFISAGITNIYGIDRLPLIAAIGIHGVVLYMDYILIYLVNGWLRQQLIPVLIFTGVFIAGYGIIWMCVWLGIRRNTEFLNRKLSK